MQKSVVLLCLHGWGGSKESFTELREALKGTELTILTPDLPGFGEAGDPPRPWTNDDYADWVETWLAKQLSIINGSAPLTTSYQLSILGHSHGGRIAIKLAQRAVSLRIDHLYLCAAAGIPHPPTFKERMGFIAAKTGKTLLSVPGLRSIQPFARKILYKILSVHDYERASPVMKETLRLVTDEDLTPLLSHINVPTDIFWGTADTQTPISDAHVMHETIKGSALHLFPGLRHRIHRDRATEIAAVIRSNIKTHASVVLRPSS
ncbi:MAG: alpha/beta hydrolase [Candidatus Peregrinibacteria bacterium]